MKHIYKLPVALMLTLLFLMPSLLSAQQVAVTKDGKEVFMQSDVNKLPLAEQKELLNSDHVIIIKSKSELQKLKDRGALLEDSRKTELDREKNIRAKTDQVLKEENLSQADAASFKELASFAKGVISNWENLSLPSNLSQDEKAEMYFKKVKTDYGYENDDPNAYKKEQLEKEIINMKAAGKSDEEIIEFIGTISRTEKKTK